MPSPRPPLKAFEKDSLDFQKPIWVALKYTDKRGNCFYVNQAYRENGNWRLTRLSVRQGAWETFLLTPDDGGKTFSLAAFADNLYLSSNKTGFSFSKEKSIFRILGEREDQTSPTLRAVLEGNLKVRIARDDGMFFELWFKDTDEKKSQTARTQDAHLIRGKKGSLFEIVVAQDPSIIIPEKVPVILKTSSEQNEWEEGHLCASLCLAMYSSDLDQNGREYTMLNILLEKYKKTAYLYEYYFGGSDSKNSNGSMVIVYPRDSMAPMYVVFRGSESIKDFIIDAQSIGTLAQFDGSKKGSMIAGAGFISQFEILNKKVLAERANHDMITRITELAQRASSILLLGHSLGGALANLCFFVLQKNKDLTSKLTLRTFGAPLVFEAGIARRLQKAYCGESNMGISSRCLRYVLNKDPVPAFSATSKLKHFGILRHIRPKLIGETSEYQFSTESVESVTLQEDMNKSKLGEALDDHRCRKYKEVFRAQMLRKS